MSNSRGPNFPAQMDARNVREKIAEVEALRAENERLRAALKKIETAKFNCTARQMWMAMQGCARDALGEGTE